MNHRHLIRSAGAIFVAVTALSSCPGWSAEATTGRQPPLSAAESSPAAIAQYRAAVALQNRDVYDLAADEWRNFLERFPGDPLAAKAQHYLGVCHFQLKDYPAARKALEAVIARYPQFELRDATIMNLGLAQFNEGQAGRPPLMDQVVVTLDRLIEQFPDGKYVPTAWFYKAEALYLRGKKPLAIAAYKRLLADYPKDPLRAKALYGLGVAQQETIAAADARATFDRFLAEFPKDSLTPEVQLRRADALLATGDVAEAAKGFAAVASRPGLPLADYALWRQAQCIEEQNDLAAAAALYSELPKKFRKSAHAQSARLAAGRCYLLAGDLVAAKKWLAAVKPDNEATAIELAHWRARALLKESKPADALKITEQALAAAGEDAAVAMLQMDRGDALYEIPARRGESIAVYAALAHDAPKDRRAPQAAYMAAYTAMEMGRYAEAVKFAETFQEAFAKHPLAADVTVVAAESLLQLKQYERALARYRGLLAKAPDRSEAETWRVRVALCLHLQEEPAKVLAYLTPLLAQLKTAPVRGDAQWLIGQSHYTLKQLEPAIAALKASVAVAPQGPHADAARLVLAQAQRDAGQVPLALATLDQLCTTAPQSALLPQACFLRGQLKAAAGDSAGARADFQRVCRKWPQNRLAPRALFALGWAELRENDAEAAEATMTRLIDQHGQHELARKALYGRASARQQAGNFAAALDDLKAVFKAEPTGMERADALYVRGLCENGLQRHQEAIDTFEEILQEVADYPAADRVMYELAWAYDDAKQRGKAIAAFGRLADAHPDSPLAGECLFRIGEANYKDKKYADAATWYAEAAAKPGDSSTREKALHKLGWSRFQLREFDPARAAWQKELDQFPTGALANDARVMVAETLFQQGEFAQAQEAFAKPRDADRKASTPQLQALALLHAAQAASHLEKWDASRTLLQQCSKAFPNSSYRDAVLYEQGWVNQNQGQLDAARKCYAQVTDRNRSPLGARARFMIGELDFKQKAYREAVRSYFQVAYGYGGAAAPEAFHSWQANSLLEAARCLEQLGKRTPAKRLYGELIQHYPKSDKVAEARKRLELLSQPVRR
jgi:TolA-binding protein